MVDGSTPAADGLPRPIDGSIEPIDGSIRPIDDSIRTDRRLHRTESTAPSNRSPSRSEPIGCSIEPIDAPSNRSPSRSEPIDGSIEPIDDSVEPIDGSIEPIDDSPSKPANSGMTDGRIFRTNVAVANQTGLMRADGVPPAEVRDLVAYSDAYMPLADELEALAQSSGTAPPPRAIRPARKR